VHEKGTRRLRKEECIEIKTTKRELKIETKSENGEVGFVVDKVVLEQVFSEYFGFPCQSSFHQLLHPHNHPGQVQ
jgi:hypothetical protein